MNTPSTRISITTLSFLNRFTDEELDNIQACELADIKRFILKATAAERIVSDHPTLIPAMSALVALGLLTEERSIEILDFANPSPRQP